MADDLLLVKDGAETQRINTETSEDGVAIQIQTTRRFPDLLQSGILKYVKLGYRYLITHLLTLLLIPLMACMMLVVFCLRHDEIWQFWVHLPINLVIVLRCSAVLVFGRTVYVLSKRRRRPVFLVDYSCYKPSDEIVVPFTKFMKHSELSGIFDDQSLEFQKKILERSGLGQETYLPSVLHLLPPQPSLVAAHEEAELVSFGVLDNLFKRTGVNPNDIGLLVVNCSLFNPLPSLSAMIVNRYKLPENIRSYNLGGMGCSAGVIAVDLAKDLLQVHGNSYSLVVSMENITQNWYFGKRRSMLIPNCLFRVGGAAVLLSNKCKDKKRAKYQLVHTVRTHTGADEKAFHCIYQEQDESGHVGVSLSKQLLAIAGDALKTNITTLGPLVLPISEQVRFFTTLIARKLLNGNIKPYIPDFKLAFDHFCIHAGGRAVIDAVARNLRLSARDVEPSRMALHRFGNVSSSSIWYELAYSEAKGRIQRGSRVWQIAFGSGFKCNSAVWVALHSIKPETDSPWAACIHHYPVVTPEMLTV